MGMIAALLLLLGQSEAEVQARHRSTLMELQKSVVAEETGQIDVALRICWRILEDPVLDPNRYPLGSDSRGYARSARSYAMRRLPAILESGGIHDQALQAYREYGKGPTIESGCGNAISQEAAFVLLGEARCLERLGRHSEAIAPLFKVEEDGLLLQDPWTSIHIVDLYEAADQIADLERILDQRDENFERRRDPKLVEKLSAKLLAWRPSYRIRRVLANRAAEKAGRWDELLRLLDTSTQDRLSTVIDAAHCLSRHPEVLEGWTDRNRPWIAYASDLAAGKIRPYRNPGTAFPSIPKDLRLK
jgi:hypothetical protein